MRDLERLVDGFQRFQQQYYEEAPSLYRNLRDGQHPSTLLVGCCDSRVDPAMLLGCDPGDIFTVRNVANLVPPPDRDQGHHGVLAAIQFAVEQLKVSRIIVPCMRAARSRMMCRPMWASPRSDTSAGS